VGQIVCATGERIALAAPQVDLAIAIAINGMKPVGGRHELGVAHRTGPGTTHICG